MEQNSKILVAEHSSAQAEMITFILEESGYEVRIVSDSKQALREIPVFSPDLVISEVNSLTINGFELCSQIKSEKHTSNIPVILLISPGESKDMLHGLESDANAVLIKPYNESILLKKIEELLHPDYLDGEGANLRKYNFILDKVPYELKTNRPKMLDMMLSMGEFAIMNNKKFQATQEDIQELNATLEERMKNGTQELQDKYDQNRSMEIQLEQNRKRYERFARNANVGILIMDEPGTIEFANAATLNVLDARSENQLVGKPFKELFHSEEQCEELFRKLKLAGKVQHEEFKLITNKGMPRWVTMNLVLKEGRISCMIFDRTGKKFIQERDLHYKDVLRNAKENAERSDLQKSFFLKGMVNQVKGPVNMITGYASLLTETGLSDDKINAYKDKVRLSTFELRNKIFQMLKLSKIDTGKVKPAENELPVVQKCKEVIKEYMQLALLLGKDQIQINCSLGAVDDHLIILTDERLFTQIVRILLDNAVRYSEKGKIDLVLDRRDEEFYVHVKDEGAGIPEGELNDIFKDSGVVPPLGEQAKVGLGLTVARKLVDLLDGRIQVQSVPGGGSDFYFTIPFREKKQDSFQENVEELAYQISQLSGKTILVAEDIYDNYFLLTAYLEHTGARIIWVKNGEEAIRKFESGVSVDIILMDIKMPGKDGFQSIRAIRARNKNIPIIVQSAYTSQEYRLKAREYGANAFLSKPIEQEQLLETLAENMTSKNSVENE